MSSMSQIVPNSGVGVKGADGDELVWKDAGWITSTSYSVLDALENDGSSYRCILAHTSAANNEPGTGVSWETYWKLVAAKGSDGTGDGTWTGITGKPSVFPPDTHTHPISEVTSLQTTLDGKSDVGHTHTIANVTGLQTSLDGKATTAQGAKADTALQPADVADVATSGDYNDLINAPAGSFFATRAAAEAATVDAGVDRIYVMHDGLVLTYIRGSANLCLRTNSSSVNWMPAEQALVQHWGAVGDFNGTTGTNNTTVINNALSWLSDGTDGRHLHFPEGWYYYDGTKTMDFNRAKFCKITMDGEITMGSSNPISWKIADLENATINVNLRNGGALGDFSTSTPSGGGTTAVQTYHNQWCTFNMHAMNYKGRVLHVTADPAIADSLGRCVRIFVNVTFGSRLLDPDDANCGQPLYVDSSTVTNVGGTGEFTIRGSACKYGPVFERLADVIIPEAEFGPCNTDGPKFYGVHTLYIGHWFSGESTTSGGFYAGNTTSGVQCKAWHINHMKIFLSNGVGAYFENFAAPTGQIGASLVIDSLICTKQTGYSGLYLSNMAGAVNIKSLHINDASNGVYLAGTNGDITMHIDGMSTLTNHGVNNQSTSCESVRLSGVIRGGASGANLLNLGSNNNTYFHIDGMHLESSVATYLIGWTHSASPNQIYHIGGQTTVGGSTTIYNGTKRPEEIRYVKDNPYST